MVGSIVFVNGTGVRLAGYNDTFAMITKQCGEAGIASEIIDCAWGDAYGVIFEGRSLPDFDVAQQEALDLARWEWMFDDPLFELDKLTIRVTPGEAFPLPPGMRPAWLNRWEAIRKYRPSFVLEKLLDRAGLKEDWGKAWNEIVVLSPIAELAFERSWEADELVEAPKALVRALVARMHVLASDAGRTPPAGGLRNRIVECLYDEWQCNVAGVGTFLADMFSRAATRYVGRGRQRFTQLASLPIGDILLYQSRGAEIRDYIRAVVEGAKGPVTLLAHSLGGIACVDMLVEKPPANVARLVTVGSQSSYFYEIDALWSMKAPQGLPEHFPAWLNIYDCTDFLSFVASPLFGERVRDHEVKSGLPFPDSHSGYFTNPEVWALIRENLNDDG